MSDKSQPQEEDVLQRIAAALERLAPPAPDAVDWLAHPAYVWNGKSDARAIATLETTPLAQLHGIDGHKEALSANLRRLADGAAAHDMLLWGSRGMGKSALVRAAVQDLQASNPQSLAFPDDC